MDSVFINLPRIAYEAKRDDGKFLALLKETVTLCVEGFKVKRRFIDERLKQPLLPILSGDNAAQPYFYEKNASYNLSFVGLSEAVEAHKGLRGGMGREGVDFALMMLEDSRKFLKDLSREEEMRIEVSQRPGDEVVERLAELDVEQYGRSVMAPDGGRGPSYYTDTPTVPLWADMPLTSRINVESKFQPAMPGGHLNIICISNDSAPAALLKLTEKAAALGCKLLTYSSNYSTCSGCGRTDYGVQPKCSRCGSDRLSYLGRASSDLLPFSLWPEAKRRSVDNRVVYTVSDATFG
jgi:anaerobic ribonucleoside-triphosphate reductase